MVYLLAFQAYLTHHIDDPIVAMISLNGSPGKYDYRTELEILEEVCQRSVAEETKEASA